MAETIARGSGPAANAAITLCEVGFAHAWNVRGDPAHDAFPTTARRVAGLDLPRRPNTSAMAADRAMLWLGPRSWLWLGASSPVDFASAREVLNEAGGALFDVSASYVMWHASGIKVPEILNRMCPLDLHDSVFGPGDCAQSMLGHVNAILHRPTRARAFLLLVARSFAEDVWAHLCASATAEGYVVAPPMKLSAVVT